MVQEFKAFYAEVKSLYVLYKEAQFGLAAAEEFAGKRYIAGVVNELRAVLHHLMEAFQAFEINPQGEEWRIELIKAKQEHLKRAIFDAYELSIILQQEAIRKLIEKYPVSDVVAVFPDFYNVIVPYFSNLAVELAEIRTSRNDHKIQNCREALGQTRKYKIIVDTKIELIEKYIKEQTKRKWKDRIVRGIIALIIGIIGYFLYPLLSENKTRANTDSPAIINSAK